MNIQEIEEMEFGDGYPNESARLMAIERMEQVGRRVSRAKVKEFTEKGLYVLISQHMVYGANTDAYLGYNEKIVLVTRSIEAIEKAMGNEYDELLSYEVVQPEG